MIDFIRETPTWIIGHPWSSAGLFVLGMAAFASLITLNPEGRQLRNLFRRKK